MEYVYEKRYRDFSVTKFPVFKSKFQPKENVLENCLRFEKALLQGFTDNSTSSKSKTKSIYFIY